MREAFNFYRSYFDILEELPDDDKLLFLKALLEKQFKGIDPIGLTGLSKFAYISQKHSIDKQVKGYERAKNTVLSESVPPKGSPSIPPNGSLAGSPPKEVQVEVQVEEEYNKRDAEKWFIDWFNDSMATIKGKKGKYKLNDKIKKQLHARIKEGYKSESFIHAFKAISKDQYHSDKGFKFLTPEFITRTDKLELWSNAAVEKLEEDKGKGSGGVSMEELYNS